MLCFFFPAVFLFGFKGILLKGILFQARFSGRTSMIGNWWLRIHIEQDEQDIMLIFFLSLTSSFPSRFVPSAGSFNLIGNLKSADPPNQNRVKSIKSTDIYIFICLGFARNRNHDRQRIIIIIIKPLLKIFKMKIEV
jgi:hypothetical protein